MLHLSTRQFTYNPAAQTFSAELSDLNGPVWAPVYQDAMDVGFTLVSMRTGAEAVFFLDQECKDWEGDITHWLFKPTPETLRKQPFLKDVSVVIFND